MSSESNYFVDGGTLRPQAASYVTRHADRELLEHIMDGEFCYVLTARQMGKSSLMIRTARNLQDRGVRVAITDLGLIGTGSIDQWYLGLLKTITSGLRAKADVSGWWRTHRDLGEPQRFVEFLRDVVLREVAEPIVVFVDEIDTTLTLDFRDDFFAAIRAMYNARASDPIFKRLTFVLLGVATPTDLIKDQRRTPFNIGTRIELDNFSYDDADPLRQGLDKVHPKQGDIILRRIFYWTNGHPYLTQHLCVIVARTPQRTWNNTEVDEIVQVHFLTDSARRDSNLASIHQRVKDAPAPERRRMLELYGAVRGGISVANDDRSAAQNYLELVGLVRVENGKLQVRNRIYWNVFDETWVQTLLPPAETPHDDVPEPKQREVVVPAWRWSWGMIAFVVLLLVVLGGGGAFAVTSFGQSQRGLQNTATALARAIASSSAQPVAAVSVSPGPPFVTPTTTNTLTPGRPTFTPASVTPSPTTTSAPPTNTLTPTPGCTPAQSLRIRRAPSETAAVVDTLPGSGFTPLARDDTGFWLLVRGTNGQVGWITASAQFVSCNFNIQSLSAATSLPASQVTSTETPTSTATPTPTP